jgi:hypothetical protein
MELELIDEQRLRIGSTVLTTSEVEQLIRDLALMRGDMAPAVARGLGSLAGLDVVGDPAMVISLISGGRVLVALRHEGFGWMLYEFGLDQAATLRDALAKRTRGVQSGLILDDRIDPKSPIQ